jgi:hypothetical protein
MLCAAVLAAGVADAADRPAYVIVPTGSPVWLDQGSAILFDSPALSVSVENRHTRPVTFTLRIWIFDQNDRLRGVMDYCVAEPLDRAMRGRFFVPLDIRGITARDRGVVTIAAAASSAESWRLDDPAADQLTAARAEVQRYHGGLSLVRGGPPAAAVPLCPCECPAIQSACEDRCASQGAAAFTCSPNPGGGCSAGCTCR